MKKSDKITPEDAENVCSMFNMKICEHRHERRMAFLVGEIDKKTMKWHQRHAKYLEELQAKLVRLMNAELKGK